MYRAWGKVYSQSNSIQEISMFHTLNIYNQAQLFLTNPKWQSLRWPGMQTKVVDFFLKVYSSKQSNALQTIRLSLKTVSNQAQMPWKQTNMWETRITRCPFWQPGVDIQNNLHSIHINSLCKKPVTDQPLYLVITTDKI